MKVKEPTKIGPYTLVRELGRGGMAQVWLAWRIWPDGKRMSCVVKFPLKKAALDPAMLRQFEQEAALSMLVQHDNIVHVFDSGNHEGLPYIVMSYVAGCNLLELILGASNAGQEWDINTAVHIVREVGYALVHAHEMTTDGQAQRVIHRDVASKNVMINLSGGVLLTDFGVASSITIRTTHNHIKGTLPYMAPEHYLGNACPASDAFGLGAILWELLEGRPFRSDVPQNELTAAIVEGIIPPLKRKVPDVVRKVVEGLLNPDVLARTRLPDALVDLEDFPNRRLQLRRMMAHLSAEGVQASGLSNVHFAASPELVQTLAVVKAAGVSLSKFDRPPMATPPSLQISEDFVFEASPRTVDIAPPSVDAGLADVGGEDVPPVEPPPSRGPTTAVIEVPIGCAPPPMARVVQTARLVRQEPHADRTPVVTERIPSPSHEHGPVSVETDRRSLRDYVAPKTERTRRPAHSPHAWEGPLPVVPACDVPTVEREHSLSPPLVPTYSGEPEQTDVHVGPTASPPARGGASPRSRWKRAAGVGAVLLAAGVSAVMVQQVRGTRVEPGVTESRETTTMAAASVVAEPSQGSVRFDGHASPDAVGGDERVLVDAPLVEEEREDDARPRVVEELGAPLEQDASPADLSGAPPPATESELEPVVEVDPEPPVEPSEPSAPSHVSSPDAKVESPREPSKAKAPPQYARVLIRRGFVEHAEIKIAGGKAHVVPGRGAVELKVRAGRRRVRWRTKPSDPWTSTMVTFAPDAVHTCLLGSSGPRISQQPGSGGAR